LDAIWGRRENVVDEKRIRGFIESELVRGPLDALSDKGSSLLEAGIIDSLGIQKLISFIEHEFSVSLKDEDIVPENFDSVSAISEMIRKRAS
jgi:acyl carrier protein